MSTVEEIEAAIRRLGPAECLKLKAWLDTYHAELWDAQLESDVLAGRLDALAEEAVANLHAGQCRDI